MGPFKLPEESWRVDLYLLYDNLQSCLLKYPLSPKAAGVQMHSTWKYFPSITKTKVNLLAGPLDCNFPVFISTINL